MNGPSIRSQTATASYSTLLHPSHIRSREQITDEQITEREKGEGEPEKKLTGEAGQQPAGVSFRACTARGGAEASECCSANFHISCLESVSSNFFFFLESSRFVTHQSA